MFSFNHFYCIYVDANTVQNKSLCVLLPENYCGLLKVYFASDKSLFEKGHYQSLKFSEIKKVTDIIPDNLVEACLKTSDGKWKRISFPADGTFNLIDAYGNVTDIIPVWTFHELVFITSQAPSLDRILKQSLPHLKSKFYWKMGSRNQSF